VIEQRMYHDEVAEIGRKCRGGWRRRSRTNAVVSLRCRETHQQPDARLSPKFAWPPRMANASELNLTARRAQSSVWERRGWDGTREIAISRWLIGVAGGVLALEGLRRRSFAGTLLAGVGGSVTWWAISGEGDLSHARRSIAQVLERAGWSTRDDLVQQNSAESFPASDAPSWTPTVGTGLRNRRVTPRPAATGR
jgi:hypothetical protein